NQHRPTESLAGPQPPAGVLADLCCLGRHGSQAEHGLAGLLFEEPQPCRRACGSLSPSTPEGSCTDRLEEKVAATRGSNSRPLQKRYRFWSPYLGWTRPCQRGAIDDKSRRFRVG